MRRATARRAAVAAAGLVSAVMVPSDGAAAWNAHGCRWPSSSVRVRNDGFTSGYGYTNVNYYNIGTNAVNAWNAAVTQFSWYSSDSPSAPYIRMYNTNRYNDGKVGLSSWACDHPYFAGNPTSTWNEYYTYDESSNFNKGVMVHEIGHTTGLGHVGSGCSDGKGGTAIMFQPSSACGYYVPQQDDIAGIHTIY